MLAEPAVAQPAGARLRYPQEVLTEANPDEDIEEGVEAGVGVRQALGDLFGQVEADRGLTVEPDGVGCLRGLQHQQAVVGELGQDEHQHHGEDDAQRPLFPKLFGLQESVDDDRVAEEHDQQWKAEAHADLHGQDKDLGLVVLVVPVDQGADGVLLLWLHRGVDKLREGQEGGDYPDPHANEFAVEQPLLLGVLSLGHLHDGDVAVHADAGEQERAAEEVHPGDGNRHLAERHAKVPALDGVHGQEGQRAQEEEVGHGEAQQVHVRHGLQTVAHGGVDPNHQQVPHGAEDEDDPVEGGLVLAAKGPDYALVTHARVLRHPGVIVVVVVGQILQSNVEKSKM